MFQTFVSLACLAAEANLVVGLRMQRIGLGGLPAVDESLLMVSEKIEASQDAFRHLASGGAFDALVSDYRTLVQANLRRLGA